ncbi:uncharacterized protein LOC126764145 isoform X2 [Bactrocera neohumeralis]|uniref:uncharacterized protein LOC120780295 isoform X2 n=1 Tax=Bactrocera tryoni TaxID=59916 RepID=UPI001A97AE17|nr:uncharacterized protein LOC120780295 isoform X2 [Bactrocera tryoni]XP_050337901.1 uncharacterized protein LOC126764145 isoform X2 [Bactrocera neohumeralis]
MYANKYLVWVVLHEVLFSIYPTVAVERQIRQSHINSSKLSLELSQSNEEDEVKVNPRWTNINAEVDVVIPMILNHLHNIKIEHLNLPDITETISLFEYNFLLQVMPIDGYGKVIGKLEDTIIRSEIAIDVTNISLALHDFRILDYRKIHVQLDQIQILRELSGLILSPITNLFKERIRTSISDGLKKEMEFIFNEFNEGDPLQLRMFAKQLLAGLIN